MNADTYEEIRDDLDTLMGNVESASLLVCFIVTRESEPGDYRLNPDFVGALFSVQTLLETLKERGDAMVHRMIALECDQPDEASKGGQP